jgi:predicted metal-dependent hydrolase
VTEEVEPAFWEGVEQFNRQQFYACHDTLEEIWMEAMEPQRTFYQGILQIAVALYHLGNANLRGATILLGEGSNRLRRYQPTYAEVDVTALVTQSTELLARLQQIQLGSGAIAPDLIANLPIITLAIAAPD